MNKRLFKRIFGDCYRKFVGIGIVMIINALITVGVSTVMMKIIDTVIPQSDMRKLLIAIAIYVGLILVQTIGSFLCTYLNSVFLVTKTNQLRDELARKIYSHKGDFLSETPKGELYAAVDSDAAVLCDFVINNIFSLLHTVCTFVVSVIYLGFLNWKLLAVILLLQPIAILVQMLFSPVITRSSKRQRDVMGEYSSVLQSVVSSPIELKLSGFLSFALDSYRKVMKKSLKATKKLLVINAVGTHVVELIGSLTVCVVIALGGFFILRGSMTIGMLMIFMTQSGKLVSAFTNLLNFSMDFSEIKPIIERVDKYIFFETDEKTGEIINSEKPDVVFDNVTFSYDGVRDIYRNMDVTFEYGKNYGIIGRTGEGKSTFIKLIYDLWEPSDGCVYLGGGAVTDVDEASIEDMVSYVSSDPLIIQDTVRKNLVMDKADITDEQLMDVLSKVDMLNEVMQLENGLDTVIGEDGATLSSGQKQRIAIARSIICKKRIMVFDEPTSAVDTATEAKLIDSIYSEFSDCTLIMITHDTDILYRCDAVFALKEGKLTRV